MPCAAAAAPAPANVLREGQPGTAVPIFNNLPPAALQLRPWYADRHLKQLATPQPMSDNYDDTKTNPAGFWDPDAFTPPPAPARPACTSLLRLPR